MDRAGFQPQEVSLPREALESMEAQTLEAATFEPGELVEQTGDFRQAEVIQADLLVIFSGLQATAPLQPGGGMEQGSSLPLPIPRPADEVSTLPVPVPHPTDEVSSLPIPVPHPTDEVSALPVPLPHPTDEVSDIPLPIPNPAEEGYWKNEFEDSPGILPGSGAEGVGITPINLPREADLASSAGGVAGSGAEGVGITPINLPREANVAADGIAGAVGGSAVDGGGIKDPGGDGVASGAVKGPGGDGVAYDTGKGPGGDPVEIGFKFYTKEPGEAAEVPLPGTAGEGRTLYIDQGDLELEFSSINDDAQWANFDLQNTMEDRQQIEAMLSNLLKGTSETAQGIIKNMKA